MTIDHSTLKIIRERISFMELKRLADVTFGEMVKGVVDIQRRVLALGGELHADGEAALLEDGSLQLDLWGFNIYPDKARDQRLEFSSFINIRPSQGTRSMEIQDLKLRELITEIVHERID